MRRVFSLIFAILLFFTTNCFADTIQSQNVSNLFINAIDSCFSSDTDSIVYDYYGNDITNQFLDICTEYYNNSDYVSIWDYAQENIGSISNVTISKEENSLKSEQKKLKFEAAQTRASSKTIPVKESKYFIARGIKSGNQTTAMEFNIVVRGKYTENANTGKILSASVSSVKMDYTSPGNNWTITPYVSTAKAVKGTYDVTFIGSMYFEAIFEVPVGPINVPGKTYKSEIFTNKFTKRTE